MAIAIDTCGAGDVASWRALQAELNRGDRSGEPAVHAQTHPCKAVAYLVHGHRDEILGCRDQLLQRLASIPWGRHIFEHILTCGYYDQSVLDTTPAVPADFGAPAWHTYGNRFPGKREWQPDRRNSPGHWTQGTRWQRERPVAAAHRAGLAAEIGSSS